MQDWAPTLPAGVAQNDSPPLHRWLAIRNHMWHQPGGGFVPMGSEEMSLAAASLLAVGETPRLRPAALRNMEMRMRSADEALV